MMSARGDCVESLLVGSLLESCTTVLAILVKGAKQSGPTTQSHVALLQRLLGRLLLFNHDFNETEGCLTRFV